MIPRFQRRSPIQLFPDHLLPPLLLLLLLLLFLPPRLLLRLLSFLLLLEPLLLLLDLHLSLLRDLFLSFFFLIGLGDADLLLDFPLLLLLTSLSSSSSSSLSDESSSLPLLLVVGTLESSLSLLGFGGDP